MKYDEVVTLLGSVGGQAATTPKAGRLLYEFVRRSGAQRVLELGFAHGNSTCYMAAALDEAGTGSILTIDRESASSREPNINALLDRTGLHRYVTPVFAHNTYNWELMRLLQNYRDGRRTRPIFDFVFIDGAHTWEVDGFAFFLVDKLLQPGGWLLFDDVHWTMAASPTIRDSERVRALPDEEKNTPQIMRVFGLLTMQHPDYSDFTVKGNWAWAYKNPSQTIGALPRDTVAKLYTELQSGRNSDLAASGFGTL